ncbi:hypothetical protein P6F26_06185 [Roseibacterium sp. SDUM158017]|uniref:hypothetical protein n=1 Tax=Roseicyclus salinarum TaxID=3036773 RepID=UPI002414EBDF|nr:hypothetical protein [Roseibacterium sp. SDUM158017]MDG4648026.1 hypothetical protein [Roseibacterium sp. SDUM158017]
MRRPTETTSFIPAPPRPGRTGATMEDKTRYQRRLNKMMRARLPNYWCAEHLDGPYGPGSKTKEWGTIPLRTETIALVKLLQQHHTATKIGPKVSLTEVVNALIEAGLPVLLRQDGWRVSGARV